MAERICEICKEPIDEDRCDGLPDTRLCGKHAEEIQQYGGEFKIVSQQERTSKAGSLKINYGGVATKKQRNHDALRRLRDDWAQQQQK